jgi:hypothetical protein
MGAFEIFGCCEKHSKVQVGARLMQAKAQGTYTFTVSCQGLDENPHRLMLEDKIVGAMASEWAPDGRTPLRRSDQPNHVCSLSLSLSCSAFPVLPPSSCCSCIVLPLTFFPFLFLLLAACLSCQVGLRFASSDQRRRHTKPFSK